MRNHRRAAYNAPRRRIRGPHDHAASASTRGTARRSARSQAARETWDRALALGEAHGYRNAQVTVIAPTGTIGLVMDCDTTGIEPDFALVKFKKLAGGGYFKIINQSLPVALAGLGYTPGADRRHRGLLRRARARSRRAAHQPRHAPRQGLRRRRPRADRAALCRAPSTSPFAFNALDARRGYVAAQLGISDAQLAEWNGNLLARARLHRGRDRRGQRLLSAAP